MKDFYYILGTDINSSAAEISEAYQRLFERFHPELNGNDKYFYDRFKDIQEAYETLHHPSKRRKYDAAFKKNHPAKINVRNRVFTSIDIAFTIILIAVTLLFGDYVVKSIGGYKSSKTVAVSVDPATAIVINHIAKPYHIKHTITVKHAHFQPVYKPAYLTNKVKPIVKTAPVINNAPIIPLTVKVSSPIERTIDAEPKYLYETYIIANATGVVNMREQDNLNSSISQVLPNNAKVQVLERGDSYYKVVYKSNTGYIPKWSAAEK